MGSSQYHHVHPSQKRVLLEGVKGQKGRYGDIGPSCNFLPYHLRVVVRHVCYGCLINKRLNSFLSLLLYD